MKVLSFDPELCVGCHICEETCSDTWFKVTDPAKSSIRIHDDGEGSFPSPILGRGAGGEGSFPSPSLGRGAGGEGSFPSPSLGRGAGGEGLLRAVFCNQCGACIAVCPTAALYRDKNGIVRIRKKQCVGCLSCVGFCPYTGMFYHPDQVEPFKCIACGKCADDCPADALAIVEVETPASPQ